MMEMLKLIQRRQSLSGLALHAAKRGWKRIEMALSRPASPKRDAMTTNGFEEGLCR